MPPTMRPVSRACRAAAARASGKLAPQRIGDGKTPQRQRARSRAKPSHGEDDGGGSEGQKALDVASGDAAHAMVAASSIWQTPSAIRGRAIARPTAAPAPLPAPRPESTAGRVIEKV